MQITMTGSLRKFHIGFSWNNVSISVLKPTKIAQYEDCRWNGVSTKKVKTYYYGVIFKNIIVTLLLSAC